MALAELLDLFARDTAAQIRAVSDAGDADAARIAADAARDRAARVAAAGAASTAEQRTAADAQLAAALRLARSDVLAARAAMLARLRAAVEAELAARLDDRVARALVADAIACAGGEPGTLRCCPALADAARTAAPASLRVEVDPAVATGAIAELASGTRIDATLATLLAREWPRLACAALERT